MIDPNGPDYPFLWKKKYYRVGDIAGSNSAVVHKLPVYLDTDASSNYLSNRSDNVSFYNKTSALIWNDWTRNPNYKPLRIVEKVWLYTHVVELIQLESSTVCWGLPVPAILGFYICDQFVECIYPQTRSVKLTDGSEVATTLHCGVQRSANTINRNYLHVEKVFLQISIYTDPMGTTV